MVGPIWALPSCHAEPAGDGGFGERLGHIGESLLERFGVNAGGADRLPGDPVLPGLKLVHPLGGELGLDPVLDGLGLLLGFLNEPLQGTQFFDFAFHLVHAHGVLSFQLMWGASAAGGFCLLASHGFGNPVPLLPVVFYPFGPSPLGRCCSLLT